jgi:hypothetical protein
LSLVEAQAAELILMAQGQEEVAELEVYYTTVQKLLKLRMVAHKL